jgi:hypothetical protein
MAMITTYEAVGIKEDISDVITNISPTKTPFQSAIGNEKVTQTLFQWQEDSLRNVAVNAVAEGADASDATIVPTVMRSNVTQILQETVKVSGTMDVVSTYGRAKESAYQLAKSSAQVKRDLENAYVGTKQTKVTGDDTTPTARKCAGYQAQIAAGSITYTGAGPAPLDEPHLLTALQNAYTAGADPSTVSVTPSNSLIVAAFAKASGRYRTINDGSDTNTKVVNAVDLYVSPFGPVRVIINRFQATGDTLIYDPSMWSKATLRPWFRETLAKTGDSLRQQIVGEFSLKHKNFAASSLVVEGTTGL